MDIEGLKEKIEEIESFLAQKSWIASYQIFLQGIQTIGRQLYDDKELSHFERDRSGGSIRVISKSKRLAEHTFSLSNISSLKEFTEPKSTQPLISISQFPLLQEPRMTSIPGDDGLWTKLTTELLDTKIESILTNVSEYSIPFTHN